MATSFKISTGLRDALLVTGSIKSQMDGTVVRIYSGTAPLTADDSIGSAVLLCLCSVGDSGTGFTFESSPVSGVLSKASAEDVYGTILTSGTASFFRISAFSDTGEASTTIKRMQGTVGLVNSDFLVRDVVFVAAEVQRIDSLNLGMPEGA